MVKRVLVILLILTFVLGLTACDLMVTIFSLSPFPAYLSQAVASADMRDEIESFLGDGYTDWESEVYVLQNSISEQVFLVVRRNPGPQKIFVFDTSLNLKVSHKIESHRQIGLVEALDENFVVGGGQFNYNDLTPMNSSDNPYPDISEDTWNKYTFEHGSRNYIVWSDPNYLGCSEYDSNWGMVSNGSTPISMDLDCRLAGLGYEPLGDPDLGGAAAVYLFVYCREWESEDGFLYIVRTLAGEYPNPSYTNDLITDGLSNGRVSSRVWDVEDRRPFHYTRKGVVVEARNRGTFRLVSLEGEVIKSFYITSDERTSFDFDIDGEYYYVFNRSNYRLYKASTGF
jgi:hypothetical protein